MSIHWTGHPFVDAGLAALATVAKARDLKELTPVHLDIAVKELQRIFLSDQALGLGVKKAFVRSAMSQVFPNSELVNPSNWKGKTLEEKAENVRRKFREAIGADLERAKRCLQTCDGNEVCYVCGERRQTDTMVIVRKDRMPMLGGIVNFYPAFDWGVRICGICALAVRFFPLSVMRTGVRNRLWFLHTQALPIVETISERYCWRHLNALIARNEALDFFSSWETAGDAGTVLYLLCELLDEFGDQLRNIYQNPIPATAYLFSNDLRNTYVQVVPIPNELLIFLAKLQLRSPSAYRKFWQELLQISSGTLGKERKARTNFVQSVAVQLLNGQDLLALCLNHEIPKLHGGWIGHRLYLQEVMKVPTAKLAILEQLGVRIALSDDHRRHVMELRNARYGDIYGILLRYVRDGWLKHDEFYVLLPPNDYKAANQVRDVLLAVIYEWQYCQEHGKPFPSSVEEPSAPPPDEILQRIRRIGEQLIERSPNLKRWLGDLQSARSVDRFRGVYLTAIRQGAIRGLRHIL